MFLIQISRYSRTDSVRLCGGYVLCRFQSWFRRLQSFGIFRKYSGNIRKYSGYSSASRAHRHGIRLRLCSIANLQSIPQTILGFLQTSTLWWVVVWLDIGCALSFFSTNISVKFDVFLEQNGAKVEILLLTAGTYVLEYVLSLISEPSSPVKELWLRSVSRRNYFRSSD